MIPVGDLADLGGQYATAGRRNQDVGAVELGLLPADHLADDLPERALAVRPAALAGPPEPGLNPQVLGYDVGHDPSYGVVRIGPATLYLGDAYHLRPQLGYHDADVFDPPYLFRAEGGGHYRKQRPNMDRLLNEGLHKGFDLDVINPLLCGATIVFAHTDQLAPLLTRVAGQFHRHALCVWQKTNPQPIANKHYRPDVEFYVHAWNRGHHPAGDMAELLRVSRITSPRGPARFDHPTTKPDALMAKIVANARGQSICDPFMGTGSTGVAAIRAGKRFTGIERDPRYFETACRRITAAVAELAQAKAA